MENTNHNAHDAEIIKEVEISVINNNNDCDRSLVKVLKDEIASLKATNASLKIQLQQLRDKFLPNILLVDDNIKARIIIKEYLNGSYNVTDVGNGIEALNMIRKMGKVGSGVKRIDLIILEVDLPGMNGYTLSREIKKNMKLKIPVFFCTARNTKKEVIKAIEAGADDYIIKPFQENTLLDKVGKWVKKRGQM